MKLFVDTGNIKDIETLATIGIIDGVTTNPSLLAKEPGDYRENLKKICGIVKGPVSGEVVSTDFAGMMRGYRAFFGTAEQPNKPARSTMQVGGLVDPGWLVEIEVTAAKK